MGNQGTDFSLHASASATGIPEYKKKGHGRWFELSLGKQRGLSEKNENMKNS